jgi:hypothetical protein
MDFADDHRGVDRESFARKGDYRCEKEEYSAEKRAGEIRHGVFRLIIGI